MLLLTKKELKKQENQTKEKGFTIIPLKIFKRKRICKNGNKCWKWINDF
jgi:tmRNA-binding protein